MKTIAYFDTSHDMPEEIIMAAGFVPGKILGDIHETSEPAGQYLQNFFCPIARSWLTEAMTDSGKWDGIVVAQGCNNTNRHFDVWKLHVKTPFLHWFNAPMKDDLPALKFFKVELKRMISAIEKQFGVKITGDNIKAAIIESNELKKSLQRLSALRSDMDITNREYIELLIACMQSPKREAAKKVDAAIAEFETRPPFPSDKMKVLLTGSDVTYPELMDMLEECGLRAVRDDLSLGERYFASLIPERNDPLDSLAEYYLNIPKPATKVGMGKRIEYLRKSLRETPVNAVISQNVKFCEPYAYDSVTVNNALKDDGFKVIHLEREYTPITDQQFMNRLQAFTENL